MKRQQNLRPRGPIEAKLGTQVRVSFHAALLNSMKERGFRPLRMATIVRAQQMGWRWSAGPRGQVLQSPRMAHYEVRLRPLSARKVCEVRFADAA